MVPLFYYFICGVASYATSHLFLYFYFPLLVRDCTWRGNVPSRKMCFFMANSFFFLLLSPCWNLNISTNCQIVQYVFIIPPKWAFFFVLKYSSYFIFSQSHIWPLNMLARIHLHSGNLAWVLFFFLGERVYWQLFRPMLPSSRALASDLWKQPGQAEGQDCYAPWRVLLVPGRSAWASFYDSTYVVYWTISKVIFNK